MKYWILILVSFWSGVFLISYIDSYWGNDTFKKVLVWLVSLGTLAAILWIFAQGLLAVW